MIDFFTELKPIAEAFQIRGKVLKTEPYGNGHINETFLVTTDEARYILQIMNVSIFKNPQALMDNICEVTAHLKSVGAETLDVIYTKSNKNYLQKEKAYRIYKFIEDTITIEKAESEELMLQAGKAFGAFQSALAHFDTTLLTNLLPDFHNTPFRLKQLLQAVHENPFDRLKTCQTELSFIMEREHSFDKIVKALKDGRIPTRVTHNDTKLNNVLLDSITLTPRAVIDLDTVMPGSLLYDFGDSIRYGCSMKEEDEQNLDSVHFHQELFISYAKGFLSQCKNDLKKAELDLMPYAGYLMTMECAMRFLTDYLMGDCYFKINSPSHNLIRTRTQLKLASEMEPLLPTLLDSLYEICSLYHP